MALVHAQAEPDFSEAFQEARATAGRDESIAKTEVLLEQFCLWARTGSGVPAKYRSIMAAAMNIEGEGTVREACISDDQALEIDRAWRQLEDARPDEALVLQLYYMHEWEIPKISRVCKTAKSTVSMLRKCGLSFIAAKIQDE
ncbi:antitermination protein Q [Phage CBW1004C-Prop1]|nr:antitermination protein Q [Phage CBW1004C-Prop1]